MYNSHEQPQSPESFDPAPTIVRLMAERSDQEARQAEERERQRLQALEEQARVWEEFLRDCRPANPADYAAWLKGFMAKDPDSPRLRYMPTFLEDKPVTTSFSIGAEGVTNHPDPSGGVEIPSAKMWVLNNLDHTHVPIAHGPASFNVIIPAGASLTQEMIERQNVGHNDFYFMDGHTTNSHWVNIYADVAELMTRQNDPGV
jgi:hypothetical protein